MHNMQNERIGTSGGMVLMIHLLEKLWFPLCTFSAPSMELEKRTPIAVPRAHAQKISHRLIWSTIFLARDFCLPFYTNRYPGGNSLFSFIKSFVSMKLHGKGAAQEMTDYFIWLCKFFASFMRKYAWVQLDWITWAQVEMSAEDKKSFYERQ